MGIPDLDTATARELFIACQDAKLDVTASRAAGIMAAMVVTFEQAGLWRVGDSIMVQWAFTYGSSSDAARTVLSRLADQLFAAHPNLVN